MDNDRLFVMLADIKEDIGALRSDVSNVSRRIDDLHKTLDAHIADDEKVATRVTKIEHAHTRLKTAAAIISTVVSGSFALGVALLKGYPWAH